MVHKHSMTVTPGFFGNLVIPHAVNAESQLTCVEVGGVGDGGFRSAAAAMLDNILSVKSKSNQDLANKLLEIHASYFEQPKISHRSTAEQQIADLMKISSRANFLSELAYVLRQETVSELCAHPAKYRGAFIANNEGTSPAQMRLQSTWIDESAIAALSKVTQVPIEVQLVEPNKELFLRLNYKADIQQPAASPIVMQLQGNHYVPKVNNPEYFESIGRQKIEAVKPTKAKPINDPELKDILADIAKEDERLLNERDNTVKRLLTMVKAGELTKKILIDFCTQSRDKSDDLQGRMQYGSQHVFEEMEAARKGFKPISLSQASHDDGVIKELVRAIAQDLTIGQAKPELLWDAIDKPSPTIS